MPQEDCGRPVGRSIIGLLRPHWWRFALAIICSVAGWPLVLVAPLVLERLLDDVGSPTAILAAAGLLIAALMLQAACQFAVQLLAGGASVRLGLDLRRRGCHGVFARNATTEPGAVLSRLTDDVVAVQNLVAPQVISVVIEFGAAIAVFGWLLLRAPAVFTSAALFVSLSLAQVRLFSSRIRAQSTEVRERLDSIFAQLKEKLDAMIVVKSYAQERSEIAEFTARIGDVHASRMRLGRLTVTFSATCQLLAGLGALAGFTAGAAAVVHGHMTAGQAAAAASMTLLLFQPIIRLGDLASAFQSAVPSVVRLAQLQPGPNASPADDCLPMPVARDIEFDAVNFAYPGGRQALHAVSFRIDAGERVAVVGPTGCGKSTLLSLLLRFEKPLSGTIRLGGVSLSALDRAQVRRLFGYVPQDPIVLRGTLADNIRFACPDASDDRVKATAQLVGVDKLAAQLPQGYQTPIGEGGWPLSQGERQRIAIARAICPDPQILLFDEATSNLDATTEREIQESMDRVLAGRTAIVVTHKLSSAIRADRVIVMDGGRIVQAGRPGELSEDSTGLFSRLVTASELCVTAA